MLAQRKVIIFLLSTVKCKHALMNLEHVDGPILAALNSSPGKLIDV